MSRNDFMRLPVMLHGGALLIAVVVVVGGVDLAWPLDDPFQEAEWAIARPDLMPETGPALLIHGGMDQAPSVLAGTRCPAGRQIACLRGINLGFQALAGWLLMALVAALGGLGSRRAWLASMPALLMVMILGGAAGTPVLGQQAVPGTRDLPVLLALLPMAAIAKRLDDGAPIGGALPGALGMIAAWAPLWSYNRGLVAALVAGAFILICAVLDRSARPALWAALGGSAALLAVTAWLGPARFAAVLHAIEYWGATGAIWRRPPERRLMAMAALPFAAAAAVLAPRWRVRHAAPGSALLSVALLAIGALYFLQALERADAGHLRWALWPAALLLAIGLRTMQGPPLVIGAVGGAALGSMALAAVALIEPGRPWDVRPGWASALSVLRSGWPEDRALAGPGLMRVAALVRASGRCSFAADNAGIVHLLSGRRACSRFAFGVYVAASEQSAVIAELAAARPSIILWDAPGWWAHIDGRGLMQRAPALADWIMRTYPVTTSVDGHLLRSAAPLDRPSAARIPSLLKPDP